MRKSNKDASTLSSAFSNQRLDDQKRARLLSTILRTTREAARDGRPIAVFDLDGTLMDNRPRVVAILHELAREWSARHPGAAERCRAAQNDDIVYGFVENLVRLGIEDPLLHEEGLAFWKARFFADPHMRHDVEIPGARSFVEACYAAGATIVYLTGRDLPNMALGTLASLRDLGFPIGVIGTELVTKPTFDMPDSEFKRGVAPSFSRFGDVVAVFDNEPGNCNIFLEAHPACASVFLDTQHAPSPPPLDPRAHVIHSFEMAEGPEV